MRNRLLAVAAIVVIGAAFLVTFAMWRHMNDARADDARADEARAVALGVPYTNFNWKTVHAQNRGCNACHADHLAADVSNVVVANSELHGLFITGYGPLRVEDCLICHGNSFADGIHSLHLYAASFTELGGNCESCHVMVDGKFVLYDDETRYDLLNGIKYNPTPPFSR